MTEIPKSTALVVDDDPAIPEFLQLILQEAGFHVLSAQSGYEAIDILAQHRVDVVVTDVSMHGMSGFDLVEHIKQQAEPIEVIMIAGHDSYDMVRRALRASAYDYLTKPLNDFDEVIDTVRRACECVRLRRENTALLGRLQASNIKVNAANKRLMQLNKQLRKLAITDSLTQLFNRRYIDDKIQNYAFSNTSLEVSYSILLLDVDHFKKINDTLGHDGGDMVLRHLANVLREVNRDSDLVGRYGGEEFIVVMPSTNQANALLAANRVRSMIEATSIVVGSQIVKITVSIGISTNLTMANRSDGQELTPAEALLSGRALVSQADKALYVAKDKGRNRCIHCNELPDNDQTDIMKIA